MSPINTTTARMFRGNTHVKGEVEKFIVKT